LPFFLWISESQNPDKCWAVVVFLEEPPPPYNHADSIQEPQITHWCHPANYKRSNKVGCNDSLQETTNIKKFEIDD
jgi:hypothetical protein